MTAEAVTVLQARQHLRRAPQPGVGQYHGYPMKMTEAFTRHVLLEWEKRKWS